MVSSPRGCAVHAASSAIDRDAAQTSLLSIALNSAPSSRSFSIPAVSSSDSIPLQSFEQGGNPKPKPKSHGCIFTSANFAPAFPFQAHITLHYFLSCHLIPVDGWDSSRTNIMVPGTVLYFTLENSS